MTYAAARGFAAEIVRRSGNADADPRFRTAMSDGTGPNARGAGADQTVRAEGGKTAFDWAANESMCREPAAR